MEVEWRPIPHVPNYSASSDGQIKCMYRRFVRGPQPSGMPRKQLRDHHGYSRISLFLNGSRKAHKVHRLIAAAFLGPCPEGMEVRHLDGDPSNNHIRNLAYGTHRENAMDTQLHGRNSYAVHPERFHRGEQIHGSKLTVDDVIAIRKKHSAGASFHSLAREYGIARSSITRACKGRTWAHVPYARE